MKKVLLHIGTGKTGSSSIQKTLAHNQAFLKKLNVSYPLYGHPTNHEELNIPLKGDKGPRAIRDRFKREAETFEEYRARLLSEFQQHLSRNPRSIISAEHLYTLNQHRIDILKQQFESCGITDVKVVIYLREPVSLYRSQVQQKLKASSHTVTPEKWKYRFYAVVERWMQNFENVEVKEFERGKLYNQDVVDDFLHICSTFFSLPDLYKLERVKATNESFSLEEMYLLQQYRKVLFSDKEDIFMPSSGALMRNFRRMGYTDSLTSAVLKDEVAEIIRFRTSSEVEQLREKVGFTLFENFKPVSTKPTKSFEHPETVLDLFKADESIHQDVLALAIRVLNRTLQ